MHSSALLATVDECSSRELMPAGTVRVLIRVTGASALLPATARLTITSDRGEPISEVALDWWDADADEAGLRAILESLKMVKRYRARRVVVYIDDESAASIAAGSEKAPPSLVGLALQVRALSHAYRSVETHFGVSSIAPTLPYRAELEGTPYAAVISPRMLGGAD